MTRELRDLFIDVMFVSAEYYKASEARGDRRVNEDEKADLFAGYTPEEVASAEYTREKY